MVHVFDPQPHVCAGNGMLQFGTPASAFGEWRIESLPKTVAFSCELARSQVPGIQPSPDGSLSLSLSLSLVSLSLSSLSLSLSLSGFFLRCGDCSPEKK